MSELQAVYALLNSITGKRYIGLSKNPKYRKTAHFGLLRKGKHSNKKLQEAFNRYGKEAFELEILEENLPEARAALREQYWIRRYQSIESGYNVSVAMYVSWREDLSFSEDTNESRWLPVTLPQSLKRKLEELAISEGFINERTKRHSPMELGVAKLIEDMVKQRSSDVK